MSNSDISLFDASHFPFGRVCFCVSNKKVEGFTFLLLGQLLSLVPDLSGVQEVGGDLDVAGSHLVDALRYGHRGAGAAVAAGYVAAG